MKTNKYYYWLDTFRFMSAFLVMLTHSRYWFFQPYSLLEEGSQNIFTRILFFITSLGGDAIVAFFILSGFLVGGRTLEKLCRGEVVSSTSFALSRLVRIIIPLAAVLLINSLFNILQGLPNDPWRLFGNLLCLQGAFVNPEPGIGVLWTMPYIVWFYVLVWAFILLAQNNSCTVLSGALVLVITLWVFAHLGSYVFYLFEVSCGIFSYFLAKKNMSKVIYIGAIITAVIATGLCHLSGSFISFQSLPIDKLFFTALQVVSYAVVIGLSVRHAPHSRNAIRFERLISCLSKFSYSLYLIHLPIIMMMVYCGIERLPYVNFWSFLLFLSGIAVCVFSGWILYVCVEKPANKLKSILSHS